MKAPVEILPFQAVDPGQPRWGANHGLACHYLWANGIKVIKQPKKPAISAPSNW